MSPFIMRSLKKIVGADFEKIDKVYFRHIHTYGGTYQSVIVGPFLVDPIFHLYDSPSMRQYQTNKLARFGHAPFLTTTCNLTECGQILSAHSIHFKKKFILQSQIFFWSSPKCSGVKLQKISAGVVAQKNREQPLCFWAFYYRKCMENKGKNVIFVNIER